MTLYNKKCSKTLMLSEESLKELYLIWKKGGYIGLIFDKIMHLFEVIILMTICIIITILDFNKMFNTKTKENELFEYFILNDQFRIWCIWCIILFFSPFIIIKIYFTFKKLFSSNIIEAKKFYNINHFQEFNRNWNGISEIIAPSTSSNRKTFVRMYNNKIDPQSNLIIRSSIAWNYNLLTLLFNRYSFFKYYPSKYLIKITQSILFPSFFDENFCRNLQYDNNLQKIWKNYIQAKTNELRFLHIFPLNIIFACYNGYLTLLKYFSSFTSKNLILLNKYHFTKYAWLLYRRYNELPHETSTRLYEAIPLAQQLTGINQKGILFHIMRVLKILISGLCLIIIPLASLTKFTFFNISSTLLLMVAIPTIALIYSQTYKKQTIKSPRQIAQYLQNFTKYYDERWENPSMERQLLTEFENSIFKSNLKQSLDEIIAPFYVNSLLSHNLFSSDSELVNLIISGELQPLPPPQFQHNTTFTSSLHGLSAYLNLVHN
ncbi:hypothetical protein, conserved [Entamoeba dispar SAW760]|uniref:Autophagy-related protein 9 n=1 Tax=Entamoeba dispar (strain ATCC PRA-260 / SAW760) TaxID=370354 RepID=B0EN77_ENTDS|nr:uncharacterized protein EDI_139440 [Entamoeba dispar SAW760]EDR24021.1 hypothetical protein, conserved [Entamoeba dispar SAW760]|eukprot:EDR24021.1 hypothetical protein, conserved [Entamoeba dispar SAW760]